MTDAEILQAMCWMAVAAKLVIEPSAATVIAALIKGAAAKDGLTAALISGGNVDLTGKPWQDAMAIG